MENIENSLGPLAIRSTLRLHDSLNIREISKIYIEIFLECKVSFHEIFLFKMITRTVTKSYSLVQGASNLALLMF